MSGFMWCRIRNAPYVQSNGKLVANQYGQQTGIEVHMVSSIYIAVSALIVVLSDVAPRIKKSNLQRGVIVACVAGIVLLCSIWIRMFMKKNSGYPFKLL